MRNKEGRHPTSSYGLCILIHRHAHMNTHILHAHVRAHTHTSMATMSVMVIKTAIKTEGVSAIGCLPITREGKAKR